MSRNVDIAATADDFLSGEGALYTTRTTTYPLRCQLELGSWTVDSVSRTITEIRHQHPQAVERSEAWARRLIGTPFCYETRLPAHPRNTIRIRFQTFDCITYVYTVVALAAAKGFDDFVSTLYHIRYAAPHDGTADEEPLSGNFIDFACESLLFNAVESGLLCDITESVGDGLELVPIRMTLQPLRRPALHDPSETTVYPRYKDRQIDTYVIRSGSLEHLDPSRIASGDVIVFTRGATDASGKPHAGLVAHAGFALAQGGAIHLLQATRAYYVRSRPSGGKTYASIAGHPEKELPGVCIAGEYLGDDASVIHDNAKCYGYDMDMPRTLASYARDNFFGVKFLRPVSHGRADDSAVAESFSFGGSSTYTP
jgi:hypothetical protein